MADAGWYPDPSEPTAQRYWDGTAWTEHQASAPGYAPALVGQPVYSQAAGGYGQSTAAQLGYGQPGYGYQQQGPPIRKFGFIEASKRGLSQWTDYSGRATVAEYWWFTLFYVLVLMVLGVILTVGSIIAVATSTTVKSTSGHSTSNISGGSALLLGLIGLVFFVVLVLFFFPHLSLLVRRLHDSDKSGWWCCLSFVAIGGLVLLVFTLMSGTPGPNQYGPPVT